MAVRNINLRSDVIDTNPEGKALEIVDWGAVNTKFQEQMGAIVTERDNQKAEIKKASDEMFDTLNNSPLGNHTGRNEALLEYADNAKQAMLMLDRNLKNGNISLKDYTISTQNLKDGTNQTFSVMEDWNADYETAMNRMSNCGKPDANGVMIDCSAAQEQFQMMQAEGLGKFEDHALYINPSNFKVTLGKRERDEETGQLTGGLSKNQDDFAEIQALRNRVKQKINKYDLEGNLDNIENHLSTEYKKAVDAGKISTVKDARENPAFKGAMENWINSMMTNDVDVGSMLTDYLKFNPNSYTNADGEEVPGGSEQYSFTMDADVAAANPSKILLIADPERPNSGHLVPDFSTENGKLQEQAVYDLINQQIEGQLDRLETVKKKEKPTKTEIDTRSAGKSAENFVVNLAQLWSGDDTQVNQILSTISGSNENIKKIWVGEDDMVHIQKLDDDGKLIEVTPIPRGDNAQEFIRAIITHVSGEHDIKDLEAAIGRSGVFEDITKGTGIGTNERTITEKVADFNTAERDSTDEGATKGEKERPSDYLATWDDGSNSGYKNAEYLKSQTDEIISFLPSQFSKNAHVVTNSEITYTNAAGEEVTLDDNRKEGSMTIYYPELMTAPITIPGRIDGDGEKAIELYNTIIQDIFNAAQQGGEKVKPNQWKSLFGDDEWSKFNNAELLMAMGIIDSADQWSDGDGIYTPGSSQLNRKPDNSGNMSEFND